MTAGPIIARELLTAARRPRIYRIRVLLAAMLLAVFWANLKGHSVYYGDVLSVSQVASFARLTFYLFAGLQGLATVAALPEFLASSIAQEKERRTLSGLLTTHLTSVEIVLGKFVARLTQFFATIAVGAPVLLLLSLLGGIDPQEILLLYATTFSMAIFIGGLAILISTLARSTRKATSTTAILAVTWLIGPFLVTFLGFAFVPRPLLTFIMPAVVWISASSPSFAFPSIIFGVVVRGVVRVRLEDFLWMIGLQISGGLLFLLLAVWRLRATYRHQEGGDGRTFGIRLREWRWRIFARRPVGDDPVFWRELHTSRTHGIAKLINVITVGLLLAAVCYWTARFAAPAIQGVFAMGYQASVDSDARRDFNGYLKVLTPWLISISTLAVAGLAAVSIPTERERDTWTSLLSTPLSGREILRAKLLASVARHWPWFATAFSLGLIGIVAGAVHPVSFLVVTLVAVSATCFAASLGIWLSVSAKITGNSSGGTLGLLLLLNIVPPMLLMYPPIQTVLLTWTCIPFMIVISYLAPADVHTMFLGSGGPIARPMGSLVAEHWLMAPITVGLCVIFYSTGAWVLWRLSCDRFDQAVGRPWRARARRGKVAKPAPPRVPTQELEAAGIATALGSRS
jgi:ABC-type Na+ efflux pump permease subunit